MGQVHAGRRAGVPKIIVVAAMVTVTVAGWLVAIPPGAGAAPAPRVRPGALAPAALPPGSVDLGSLSPRQQLHLTVVLGPSDPGAVSRLLQGLYDPASPTFHHWLAPGAFSRQFGPAPGVVASTLSWLHGTRLTRTSASGAAVRVDASAGVVSAALGVPIHRYRDPKGHVGYHATGVPLVPESLAGGAVRGILGLDSVATFQPQHTTSPAPESPAPEGTAPESTATPAAPGAASADSSAAAPHADGLTPCAAAQTAAGGPSPSFYTLDALGSAYGVGTLVGDGQRGQHTTIGLYELAPHSASDVSSYLSCFRLANPVGTATVDGGGTVNAGGTAEADLDIEQAATQAPGASLLSYEGPNTGAGAYDTWSEIVQADAAQVVSTSWGACELVGSGTYTGLFEQAAAQGQTILAASGDSGSEDCFRSLASTDPSSTSEQVDYPASDPWVTAVGGTSRFGPADEVTWNACQSNESISSATNDGGTAAAGGGMSRFEAKAAYQPAVLTWPNAQGCGVTCREVPDISANAGVGMVVFANGSWRAYGGTSFAAPLLAGIAADHDSGCRANAGLWNPALYGLAADGSYGTALHDVTSGNNDMTGSNGGQFAAGTGYDAATGLGSPLAAGLSCPEVTSVGAGTAGSHVTVRGLGLEHATVTFGGAHAQLLSSSATQATVVVPAGAGTVRVAASSVNGSGIVTSAFSYGTAPPPPPPPTPHGYWLVSGDGGIFTFGSAHFYGSTGSLRLQRPVVGITPTKDRAGYWLVASDGGVFAFGDAGFFGSIPGIGISPAGSAGPGPNLAAPIVGIVPSERGGGYFMVASDGGVFAFGDARFAGSCPGIGGCAGSAVAVMPDATGNGYWLVTSTGNVYAFGDAPFDGEPGPRAAPVTSAVATPDGRGYWVLFADGVVDAYGDAANEGEPGGAAGSPTTAIFSTSDGRGYWVTTTAGAVFAFGDAPSDGGMAGHSLNAPIIAAVGW